MSWKVLWGDCTVWYFCSVMMLMCYLCVDVSLNVNHLLNQVHIDYTTKKLLNLFITHCDWPGGDIWQTWLSLVLVVVCHLFGAKPLPETMLIYGQLVPEEKVQWKFNPNTKLFFQDNAFKNVVCKMAAILLKSQCDEQTVWEGLQNFCRILSVWFIIQRKLRKTNKTKEEKNFAWANHGVSIF